MNILNICKEHYPNLQWELLNEKSEKEKHDKFGGLGYEVYLGSIADNSITLCVRRINESDVSLSLRAVSQVHGIFETNCTDGKIEDLKTLFKHLKEDWTFHDPKCKQIFINEGLKTDIEKWQSELRAQR